MPTAPQDTTTTALEILRELRGGMGPEDEPLVVTVTDVTRAVPTERDHASSRAAE
ncbi:hypothetical protein [Halorientalis halophila]|uniref:hypothetical protein n=1 Tax=Halorientalis halophila TaxID=3108499 RepID=UPI00300A92E0